MAASVGSRVTMRYRLPPGYSHPMTDVIGELIEVNDALVAVKASDGRIVRVAADRVIALKTLGARPVRTSEIRALERAAVDGWPGIEQEWIEGWLLRAGRGFTGRANCATPLEPHASVSAIESISQWYQARGLQPVLLLPDRLGEVPSGWTTWHETLVMAADISQLQLPLQSVSVLSGVPDEGWLGFYRYRGRPVPDGAREVIEAVQDGIATFAAIGSASTTILAIGRAAVTSAPDGRQWVGLTAIEVAGAHRRNGVGTRICGELIAWGREQGATHTYLQVSSENAAAIAMYRGLGFSEHHRYRYAASPQNSANT